MIKLVVFISTWGRPFSLLFSLRGRNLVCEEFLCCFGSRWLWLLHPSRLLVNAARLSYVVKILDCFSGRRVKLSCVFIVLFLLLSGRTVTRGTEESGSVTLKIGILTALWVRLYFCRCMWGRWGRHSVELAFGLFESRVFDWCRYYLVLLYLSLLLFWTPRVDISRIQGVGSSFRSKAFFQTICLSTLYILSSICLSSILAIRVTTQ